MFITTPKKIDSGIIYANCIQEQLFISLLANFIESITNFIKASQIYKSSQVKQRLYNT